MRSICRTGASVGVAVGAILSSLAYARAGDPVAASPRSRSESDRAAEATATRGASSGICTRTQVAPGVWVGFPCSLFPGPNALAPTNRSPSAALGFVAERAALPANVDHRVDHTEGPIRDQGETGTCWAMALASAMDHEVRRMGRKDAISVMHIWSTHNVPVHASLALERTWPYDAAAACEISIYPDPCSSVFGVANGTGDRDPKIQAQKRRADAQASYTLSAVEDVPKTRAIADDIVAMLARGDDVWVSMWVDPRAWSAVSAHNAVIPDYEVTRGEHHDVLLAGYRSVAGSRQFLIHNSWGKTWGEGGYGWISEAMVMRYVRSAKRVHVTERQRPPNVGAATPCRQGQMIDALLGACASACPDGTAPAAGVCLPPVLGGPGGLGSSTVVRDQLGTITKVTDSIWAIAPEGSTMRLCFAGPLATPTILVDGKKVVFSGIVGSAPPNTRMACQPFAATAVQPR